MQFNPHIEGVQYPPISEVKGWLQEYTPPAERPLVDCCQAIPDYPPADELVSFLRERLVDPVVSRYSPDEGLPEVRESVAGWYGRRYGSPVDPEEICLTIGASQAFWLAMTALCRAGDEIVLAAPAYFDHAMALETLGIQAVWVPFDEQSSGQLSPESFAERITPRTRALLVVTPSNPTGAVTSPEMLQKLFEIAANHNLALVLDETYNSFLPLGRRPHDLFAVKNWQEHFVHLASFGKTFALTGYRAGALVAGRCLIRQALKVQDTMAVCQPCITQLAVQYGCDHLDSWIADKAAMMQRRHDLFRSRWDESVSPFDLVASGSFFAWVKHPWNGLDSRSAAHRLLTEASVISLPGAAFGPGLDSYLRLAFGNLPEAQIPTAISRFSFLS